MIHRLLRKTWVGCLVLLAVGSARGQDLLNDADHMFLDEAMVHRRYGIELEFSGVADEVIEKIIVEKFSAKMIERQPNGTIVFETPHGTVQLKIEGRAWRFEKDRQAYERQLKIDLREAPRELVFPPLRYRHSHLLQEVADTLRENGAIGTNPRNAVSTQVNVEMRPLRKSPGAVRDLVNLMRVYSLPEHAEQIVDRLKVPSIRREYINDYSEGFLEKLLDADYNPTARQLFDDYFYRQGLEVLGYRNAWTMPLSEARHELLNRVSQDPDVIGASVVKMQRLRVSSLLLHAFPRDPLSKLILKTRWAKAVPLVEFREANTDFNVLSTLRQALGVVRSAEVYGYYSHDVLVSNLTGIDPRDLEALRRHLPSAKVVRYALQDPAKRYLLKQNGKRPRTLWIQLNPDTVGHQPLVLDGETVVFHRRHIHRKTILGKYNPGLENYLIQQAMENKLFEGRLFSRYAPESVPPMRSLTELTGGRRVSTDQLVAILKREFPNGWVMKGSWDLATEKAFISDESDIAALLKEYRNGFEAHRRRTEKELEGADPEELLARLKEHPGFKGWKIHMLLSQPNSVFFQTRVDIEREYRVEVQGGKVLGEGSTVLRYGYLKKRRPKIRHEEVAAAERFVQSVVDRLPEPMRILPYGFDVALLKNGNWTVIESNPGGNSSFLEEEPASMRALDRYLQSYPERVKRGELRTLSAEDQMNWIRDRFKEFELTPRRHYPGIRFTKDDIVDKDYPSLPRPDCEELLAAG